MSNFKNWRTPGALEEFQRKQLERRLSEQDSRVYHVSNSGKQTDIGFVPAKPAIKPRKPKAAKPKGESANAITANVIRCINMQPKCVAYRINNVGIWDEKKQIHRRANTQKGIFDISATIKGRSAWFEIKAGYDKPSQDQLIFQQEVIRAGGIAEFIRSTEEFQKLFTVILLDL